MFLQASVLAALAAVASAHLVLDNPVPFVYEDPGTAQSPLAPEHFPCKQPGGTYAIQTMNTVAAGDTLQVHIKGGATHGGGSCQFSITTDAKPNKDSQWKVLHSQIHGCVGALGKSMDNMSGDKDDMGSPKVPVTIPKDLPAGTYTFAWSWFNKLGNREFYMNCAPLEVTGGSGDVSKVLGGLPDMFVANLPNTEDDAANGCTVGPGQDFVYPDPGPSVATGEEAAPGTTMDGPGCAKQNLMGRGAGKLGAPAGGAPATPPVNDTPDVPAPSAPATPETPKEPEAPKPSPTTPGQVLAPSAAPSAAPVTPPVTPPTTGDKPAGCTPCTKDGAVVCIDASSFGLCNFGCAIPQPLAAGMKCTEGAIIGARDIKLRRAVHKHAKAHASL